MDYPVRTPSQLQPLLKGFRTKAGLTQTALSKRLGITQQALSELEREPQNASMDRLLPLLSALGVAVVFREDRPREPSAEW
jgi:HTH-type transcriptional regulator / antitoxin HipB